VVHRCLEKRPERRFQSASDLAFALENLSGSTTSTHVLSKESKLWLASRETPRVGDCLLLISLLSLVVISRRRHPAFTQPLLRLSITAPADSHVDDFALSPDAAICVTTLSSNKRVVMIRSLASDETRIVPESDGAFALFWSPDSRFIGFYEGLRN